MGPRLQERGVSLQRERPALKILASMGPRLQERGVRRRTHGLRSGCRGFNGAALTRARSFPGIVSGLACLTLLQWGRAYKSAELGAVSSAASIAFWLQWGRAYKSAELHLWDHSKFRFLSASMGPRLQERGVLVRSSLRPGGIQASMGPRLQERGVGDARYRRRYRRAGFNGAALTRARSSDPVAFINDNSTEASMGPRLQERGVELLPEAFRLFLCSFNGAALTRARSFLWPQRSRSGTSRFNGAALTRARSFGSSVVLHR